MFEDFRIIGTKYINLGLFPFVIFDDESFCRFQKAIGVHQDFWQNMDVWEKAKVSCSYQTLSLIKFDLNIQQQVYCRDQVDLQSPGFDALCIAYILLESEKKC